MCHESLTMHVHTETFIRDSAAAVQNKPLQARLRVLSGFGIHRNAAFAELKDGESLRDRAREIKKEAVENLDHYLTELEANLIRIGGAVHWARTGEEATTIVLDLARKNNVKRV